MRISVKFVLGTILIFAVIHIVTAKTNKSKVVVKASKNNSFSKTNTKTSTNDNKTTKSPPPPTASTKTSTNDNKTTKSPPTPTASTKASTNDSKTTKIPPSSAASTKTSTNDCKTTKIPPSSAASTKTSTNDSKTTKIPPSSTASTKTSTNDSKTTKIPPSSAASTKTSTNDSKTTKSPPSPTASTKTSTNDSKTTKIPPSSAASTKTSTNDSKTTKSPPSSTASTKTSTNDSKTTKSPPSSTASTKTSTNDSKTTKIPPSSTASTKTSTNDSKTTKSPPSSTASTKTSTNDSKTTKSPPSPTASTKTSTNDSKTTKSPPSPTASTKTSTNDSKTTKSPPSSTASTKTSTNDSKTTKSPSSPTASTKTPTNDSKTTKSPPSPTTNTQVSKNDSKTSNSPSTTTISTPTSTNDTKTSYSQSFTTESTKTSTKEDETSYNPPTTAESTQSSTQDRETSHSRSSSSASFHTPTYVSETSAAPITTGSSSGTTPNPKPNPDEGNVTIAEVYYKLPHTEDPGNLPNYIELYGDQKLSLSGYTIVLFGGDNMTAFLIVSLDTESLREDGSFVISTSNVSIDADLIIEDGSMTYPEEQNTVVALYKIHSSTFTLNSDVPSTKGLIDYVVYGFNGTMDIPVVISGWSPGLKAVVKDAGYPQESISRCFSDEPRNQRAFTLSAPTPGKKNLCAFQDDVPIINEVGHIGGFMNQPCFIEIQLSQNASLALNSFFLAIYSKGNISSSVKNVTFDLWNVRTDENGYYVLSSSSDTFDLNCGRDFVNGTMVVILYQVPTDLRHFNRDISDQDTYQFIKDGLAFDPSPSPMDKTFVQHVLPESEDYKRFYIQERGPTFLSGNQSISWCKDSYALTDPSPGLPNYCLQKPVVTTPAFTISTLQSVVYINEIRLSPDSSQEYIEFKGSHNFDMTEYYLILFDSCSGQILERILVNIHLNENGLFLLKNSSGTSFAEELNKSGSIAVGLYKHYVPFMNATNGLVDAVILSLGRKCPYITTTLSKLTPNAQAISVESSMLKQGMTLSRCSTTSIRNSQSFVVNKLNAGTPGMKNSDCPLPPVQPTNDPNNNAVMVTIAVVASCLVVFLIIIGILVFIMKRKRKGVLQFRLARMDNDDDDELITNIMDPVVDDLAIYNDDATFENDSYGSLH